MSQPPENQGGGQPQGEPVMRKRTMATGVPNQGNPNQPNPNQNPNNQPNPNNPNMNPNQGAPHRPSNAIPLDPNRMQVQGRGDQIPQQRQPSVEGGTGQGRGRGEVVIVRGGGRGRGEPMMGEGGQRVIVQQGGGRGRGMDPNQGGMINPNQGPNQNQGNPNQGQGVNPNQNLGQPQNLGGQPQGGFVPQNQGEPQRVNPPVQPTQPTQTTPEKKEGGGFTQSGGGDAVQPTGGRERRDGAPMMGRRDTMMFTQPVVPQETPVENKPAPERPETKPMDVRPTEGGGRERADRREGAPMMGRRDTQFFNIQPTATASTGASTSPPERPEFRPPERPEKGPSEGTTRSDTRAAPMMGRRDTVFIPKTTDSSSTSSGGGLINIQNDYNPNSGGATSSSGGAGGSRFLPNALGGGRKNSDSQQGLQGAGSQPGLVQPSRPTNTPPPLTRQDARTQMVQGIPQMLQRPLNVQDMPISASRDMNLARPDWFNLGETQVFHHHRLYKNSDWQQIDFKRYRIVPAKFGGPVALIKQKQANQYGADQDGNDIDIYTSSAKPLGKILTKDWGKSVVEIGWNDVEQLVVILPNEVMIYAISGELQKSYKLDDTAVEAKIWGTGFVTMTKDLQFVATIDFEKPYQVKLKNPALSAPPTCWSFIEPQLSADSTLEVIICTSYGGVLVLSEKLRMDVNVQVGMCSFVTVSPSGKIIAFYTEKGHLWILTSDFSTELTNFLTRAPHAPLQVEWCGGDAIACYWETQMEHLVLMVGPDASYRPLKFDQPLILSSECDGIRIIGQGESGFITKISKSQQLAYNSIPNAASMLLEASDYFHNQQSPKSDDILRKIKSEMTAAVQVLIDAAGYEFNADKQQDLLLAAGFGKGMEEEVKAFALEPMVKILRILNTIRTEEIGIPLSISQYQILTPQILINRLLNRNLHQLSFELCDYLGFKADVVLVHWATRKVTSKMSDDVILSQIKDKTKHTPGISFAAVAYAAFQHNKPQLATRLLDEEACAADQVPLLISMGKQSLALEKACMAGDTDLIQLALLVLHSKLSQADFYALLRPHEEAQCIWEAYCRDANRDELLAMYRAGGGNERLAKAEVIEAFMCENLDERHDHLKVASSIYKKTDKFAHQETKDHIQLLIIQRELEISLSTPFVGSSLSNTLYRCILLGAEKRAKAIRTQFNVQSKRWWWIKMRAYGAAGKWDSLRRFSEQESPIGYKPFVEVCLEHKNEIEAVYYVKMVKDEVEKVKLYIRLNKWMEAIDAVYHFRGEAVEIIAYMKAKCTQGAFKIKIEELEAKYNNGEIGTFLGALGVPQIQLWGMDINS